MEAREYVVFGLIALGLIVVSAMSPELSSYSFIACVVVIVFIIYLKLQDNNVGFDFEEYDELLAKKLVINSVKNFRGEVDDVYLTGEDVFPMKHLGKCIGYFSYSFDVYPVKFKEVMEKGVLKKIEDLVEKSKDTRELYCFYYAEYSSMWLRSVIQKVVPMVPIMRDVLGMLPFFNSFCFPDTRAVLTSEYRVMFKKNLVEIKGKSLIPLSVKKNFNLYYLVEYEGKSDETRKMERFLFAKEIFSDEFIKLVNTAKNASDIGAKLNPQVKVEQEKSLMKT